MEIRQTNQLHPEKFDISNNGIALAAKEAWKAPAGAAPPTCRRLQASETHQ